MNKIYPTLYKRAVNGKIVEYTIEVLDNHHRTISGYTDGIKTTSEWTICEAKTYCTAIEQAIREADAIFRKCIDAGYFSNIKDIDKVTFFKPMLAHKIEDYLDNIKPPFYSQPKLDGIRCIIKANGMWSRTGKKIISTPHIFNVLKPLFNTNPDLILDGELYADKLANDFNKICSLVKKTKPSFVDLQESAEKIEYHVYDIPSINDKFSKRIEILDELLGSYHQSVKVVTTTLIDDMSMVETHFNEYIQGGYEGQMIRLDEHYENKRSKYLLKHKTFIDEEYTIIDIEEGIGNKTGMVGAFVFEAGNGKTFKASPKFNWDECKEMWLNKNELIGKQATVKYFNLTPDGIPRFPYTIAIRDYE
jgi:DNA ligase-1